jgi:Bifunctional DNA primase/polymerase, N-terminal/Primase C terminal 1 (PriCT-1)
MTDYAPLRAEGLSVGSVPYGRKAPPPEGWDRWCVTPPTDEELAAMFRGGPHNIAVFCGPASGGLDVMGEPLSSGLVVLVFNDRALFEAFTAGVLPPTWIAESVCGQHPYIRINGELPNTTYWTSRRTGKLAVLELRSTGAYVIAPQSKHPDGPRYVWVQQTPHILELDREDFDAWLGQGLANARVRGWPLERGIERTAGAAPTVGGDITEGARDITLTSFAGTMRRRGMSAAAILAALRAENRDRCKPPLDDRDVERIARSIGRYPADEHTCPTCGWSNQVAPVLKRVARTVRVG